MTASGTGKRPPKILLVEDSPADAELAVIGLQQSRPDAVIDVVDDGEQALRLLRGEQSEASTPDLVLLDLNLPGLDGLEILDTLKTDPRLARIPVVVFSNSNASTDIADAYDRGASAYLLKPMEYAAIKDALGRLMDYWYDVVCLPPTPARSGQE